MAKFKIGDKVRITINGDMGKTGIIMAEGAFPNTIIRDVQPNKEGHREETKSFWWKVKLDVTGEEKEFPDDKLEEILPNAII